MTHPAQIAVFTSSDVYCCSLKSGGLWYKSRQLETSTFFPMVLVRRRDSEREGLGLVYEAHGESVLRQGQWFQGRQGHWLQGSTVIRMSRPAVSTVLSNVWYWSRPMCTAGDAGCGVLEAVRAANHLHFTESVYEVVLQKSISPQIRQLILYHYLHKEQVDGFVWE